ncbi:hypothetical protein D3C80_2016060 [compost metagenome]
MALQPTVEGAAFGEWAIGQVIPQGRVGLRALQDVPQVVAVTCRVEFFKADEAALDGVCRGCLGGFPVQCVGHVVPTTLCGIE